MCSPEQMLPRSKASQRRSSMAQIVDMESVRSLLESRRGICWRLLRLQGVPKHSAGTVYVDRQPTQVSIWLQMQSIEELRFTHPDRLVGSRIIHGPYLEGVRMVFPIVPVAATSAIIFGGVALVWYSRLTPHEKEAADVRANELAREWYGVALDKLSKYKFLKVILAVKREFTGSPDNDPVGE